MVYLKKDLSVFIYDVDNDLKPQVTS